MNQRRNILLCGHNSFASRGLVELLNADGHKVMCFSRGPVAIDGNVVTGPVNEIHENPHFAGPIDTVINYILLKGRNIEENNEFLDSLLNLCREKNVKHLIHVSSVSVYSGSEKLIREDSLVESDPNRKGSYGSLKVATDHFLQSRAIPGIKLTFVRPGFILGEGLMDPIVGMGFRVGLNRILMIGSGSNVVPVTSRDILNEAMVRMIALPPEQDSQVFLILDTRSPTRREWLDANRYITGTGTKLISFPVPLWLMAGLGGEVVARLVRMKLSPLKIIRNACRSQRFDSSVSQHRLEIDMSLDWKKTLAQSMPGQDPCFSLPYKKIPRSDFRVKDVTFWGFGKIVEQKHLPALKRLGFNGSVTAYDPVKSSYRDRNVTVRPIKTASPEPTELMVIVSPGPFHAEAIPIMKSTNATILIEKPLCNTKEELAQWQDFERTHSHPIVVCHNYRYKSNVEAMMAHLDQFNPGRLLQVDVQFQSPSVSRESRMWAKDERRARTLLMDYSIHFIDIACMFDEQWSVGDVSYDLDHMGYTAAIHGHMESPKYRVNFILRQGYMPRRARLFFTFQNYGISLGFFPDTFVAHMADDGPALYAAEKRMSGKAFRRKVFDKALSRDSDHSHDLVYLLAMNNPDGLRDALTVQRLAGFYRAVCDLGSAVYD